MAATGGTREELRSYVRPGQVGLERTVAVRGGPDDVEKLRRHATRTHRAYVLDDRPVLGVSVFCALDDTGPASLLGLLEHRLASYRWVHTPPAARLEASGFVLLPTFARPHFTVVLDEVGDERLRQLQLTLGPPTENPYHRRGRAGR